MNLRIEEKLPGTSLHKRRFLWITGFVTVLLILSGILGVSGYVGWNLTHPVHVALDADPSSVGLAFENVVFPSRLDGLHMKGWLIPAAGSDKTVIFAHGYRKNRLNSNIPILAIAQYLNGKGYNILMFDFRNSGESEGNLTSVGQYEVRDLLGAVDFIKARPQISQEVILYGFSMGAATAILAGAREPVVNAIIADSPFADLSSYLNNNLSVWSGLPSFPFNRAFFLVVPPLTGLKPDTVSPINEINQLNGRPLLLIHGEEDIDVPIENSEMLKKAYPQAQFLRVQGGTHVQNYAAQPQLYLSTVMAFLNQIQSPANKPRDS
ncbi:MAG TPA: alpha/beta fold hydrolase [Syntrophomonadaceae bacterium]|nr:alpha/beta fold hydrolase [Syntrophomonadaceae bacterium]